MISLEKDLKKNENYLSMTFVRDKIVAKTVFGDVISFTNGHGKENLMNARI